MKFSRGLKQHSGNLKIGGGGVGGGCYDCTKEKPRIKKESIFCIASADCPTIHAAIKLANHQQFQAE